MKTELEDVMHLYLGCEVKTTHYGKGILKGLNIHDVHLVEIKGESKTFRLNQFKPILRQLSDMTKEENICYSRTGLRHISESVENYDSIRIESEKTAYLLKQGFDLFNLISTGQAIDKTKLIINKN